VQFQVKAVFFPQGEGRAMLQGVIRPAIKTAIKSNSGFFDGVCWLSSFQRIINEVIRQNLEGEEFKDIYSVPRIRQPTD
jgi:hypothetical protein